MVLHEPTVNFEMLLIPKSSKNTTNRMLSQQLFDLEQIFGRRVTNLTVNKQAMTILNN